MQEFEPITRPSSEYLDSILGEPHPVLDHGFIRVVDYLGNEASVVQGARVSYGAGTKTVNEDVGLLRHLMRHWHTSPYELAVIKLHVKLPIFVERQWVRHRTCSMNEISGRYSVLPAESYIPEITRLLTQKKTNKQGSSAELVDAPLKVQDQIVEGAKNAFGDYADFIDADLAREVARVNLPVGTYTEKYWQMNLHNLLHFLKLRMDPHAQWEIRQYGTVIGDIVKGWLPGVWQAFEDFRLNSMTFSAIEMRIVGAVLRNDLEDASDFAGEVGWLDRKEDGTLKRRSERIEFEAKLDAMDVAYPWIHLEA